MRMKGTWRLDFGSVTNGEQLFYFDADLDPNFYIDSDPHLHHSDANLQPPAYRPSTAPSWAFPTQELNCEHPQLLAFPLMRIRPLLPKIMQIRICRHASILASTKSYLFSSVPDPWHLGTDPDPQLWLTYPDPALFIDDLQDATK